MTVGVPDIVLKTGVIVEGFPSSFTVTQGSKATSVALGSMGFGME